MNKYLENCFNRSVCIEPNEELFKKLPLRYKGLYNLFLVKIGKVEWMLLEPKNDVRLNSLRKDRNQIEKISNLNCALYFDSLRFYPKEKLMEEGIPFIIVGKQMFLPFLGMILSEKSDRPLAPVRQISFLTQKMILCALYENWQGMNVTRIAKQLNVSKMSVSRCLDEMEYFDLNLLDLSGKYRKVTVKGDIKENWENLKHILRSPVIERFSLQENVEINNRAGMSALSELSMISDNRYPTYCVTKNEIGQSKIRTRKIALLESETCCEVLEVGYFIDFQNKKIQDPFSIWLSLSDEEKADDRVQICIDEMLEEYVW